MVDLLLSEKENLGMIHHFYPNYLKDTGKTLYFTTKNAQQGISF